MDAMDICSEFMSRSLRQSIESATRSTAHRLGSAFLLNPSLAASLFSRPPFHLAACTLRSSPNCPPQSGCPSPPCLIAVVRSHLTVPEPVPSALTHHDPCMQVVLRQATSRRMLLCQVCSQHVIMVCLQSASACAITIRMI